MRTVFPERRTLPSRIAPTLSSRAMTSILTSLPLKEKAEVRAATCRLLTLVSELRISSVKPSEKYSCSLSPLMFTNGSTAMECGGGLKAAGDAAGGGAALDVAELPAGFEIHGLL